jgi:5-formyltetrahydrofolate cyclo-ligase
MIQKEIFRKNCIKNSKKIVKNTNFYKLAKQSSINLEKLLISLLYKKMNILFYFSMKSEVPTYKLILKYRRKHKIFIPFMQKESFKMVVFRLPIKKNKIKSSENSIFYKNKRDDIDIIIVPIIGLDKTKRRIGFGKGMYDRFYANLRHKPIVVFTQVKKCFSQNIISEMHDIKGDFVINAYTKFK